MFENCRFAFEISCCRIAVWNAGWLSTKMAMSSFTTSRLSARPRSAPTPSSTFCSTNWSTSSGGCFSCPADSSSSRPVMAICARTSRDCCDHLRRPCTTWRRYPSRACPSPTSDRPGSCHFSTWAPNKTLTIRNFFRCVKSIDKTLDKMALFYLNIF